MNTIEYLKGIYGYNNPIFLKDIRIGGKSKTAIRQELSRAVKKGKIERKDEGIYFFSEKGLDVPSTISFESIVQKRFIEDELLPGLALDIYGYYSGQTFLHLIGISQQVPAVLEITTNNTSCKRLFVIGKRKAILRKGRTEITRLNYKALQFFDIFSFLDDEDVEKNKELLLDYIKQNLTRKDYVDNIKYYPNRVNKLIVEKGFIHAFR